MLKFEDSFTLDKKVDAFLREFVNNALKRAVAGFIECCENKDDEVYFPKFVYDDDLPSCVFPKSYPGNEEQMLAVLKGLYSLLNSDKEFVPTLLMEYVLAHIIQACIDIYYDEQSDIEEYGEDNFEEFEEELLAGMSKETREAFLQQKKEWERDNHTPDKSVNFPFSNKTHMNIVKAYTDLYMEETDIEDEREARKACKEDAENMVDSLWHFSDEWLEFCFWDDDYMMLDTISEWKLRQSELNSATGALPQSPMDDAFFLPKDWKNSKDFHYLTDDK